MTQWQSEHVVLTVPGEDADISNTESWDMAMEARKSSTCLRDRELWRVSKGQIEGTMEYNSKPLMKYTTSESEKMARKHLQVELSYSMNYDLRSWRDGRDMAFHFL